MMQHRGTVTYVTISPLESVPHVCLRGKWLDTVGFTLGRKYVVLIEERDGVVALVLKPVSNDEVTNEKSDPLAQAPVEVDEIAL